MRTLTVTMLAATGLLCLAPGAGAARGHNLSVSGQASHLRPAVGELDVVRCTVTNSGDKHVDQVRLDTAVPTGWTVRQGPGCAQSGAYLRCQLGALEPGRHASVDVPMIVHKPVGTVQLRAWAGASVGKLTVPG